VEDAGRGVPEDALPRLFEKFYRVSRLGQRSKGGSGVGLAVVRGFAEAMGGRVSARRSDLGGLAIDLDLPVAAAGTADAVDAPPATAG
jgi:two-component system sensor histidine kinase BaeS